MMGIGEAFAVMGYNTLKRTDKYKIEYWRPYGSVIDKIYSKNVDGVLHRVFPSKRIRIPRTTGFKKCQLFYGWRRF